MRARAAKGDHEEVVAATAVAAEDNAAVIANLPAPGAPAVLLPLLPLHSLASAATSLTPRIVLA